MRRASWRRPDDALCGADPGPAGPLRRPRPCGRESSQRLLAGRLRHAQATPVPGGRRPRGRRVRRARRHRRTRPAGTSRPTPGITSRAAATGTAGRDALWRGDLRGPGRQSLRRPRRGRRLDLRARHRHRVLRDRPALHRRRQPARSRQRAGRGMGQRVRPGLPRPVGRRLRDHRRRRPDALRRGTTRSWSGSASRPATCATGPARTPH